MYKKIVSNVQIYVHKYILVQNSGHNKFNKNY